MNLTGNKHNKCVMLAAIADGTSNALCYVPARH